MAQYRDYIEGQYDYVTDAVTGMKVRFGQRSDNYVEDAELLVGGFLLAENVGWKNLTSKTTITVGDKFRIGARDTAYVIDVETNGTFLGTEDVDWEELQESKPV